ncbi:5-methyltetrahydropteroyltriglutamate--homocysteine methyltransferase 2-like [Miscanthus floridulus]|uniref:5-methyltetrahydropteroyltriglutamate-- homocysteine methyltransferase 2-like n=1 Tax=Miscanthus floridulus TaxID=154761 RepID=UPI0034596A74
MASHIVGYPRMGPKRELKFALESFWDGKSSTEDLEKVATDLRSSIWKQMSEAGIKYIPSNTFSYYDQVLDTTAMLGAVLERYSWTGGEIGLSTYFSMARGNASVPAMEMTKWFDTNYHFIVPELGPSTKFTYASHKAVSEYKEAKAHSVSHKFQALLASSNTFYCITLGGNGELGAPPSLTIRSGVSAPPSTGLDSPPSATDPGENGVGLFLRNAKNTLVFRVDVLEAELISMKKNQA